MNLRCKVCGEKAAGFHFGAFTCEGCKSFFGRCCNNMSLIGECRNNKECIIDKKNRTSCKACRLQKCLLVGMSKNGSRYGRRSNWFKQFFQEMEHRAGRTMKTTDAADDEHVDRRADAPPLISPRYMVEDKSNHKVLSANLRRRTSVSSHSYLNYLPQYSLNRLISHDSYEAKCWLPNSVPLAFLNGDIRVNEYFERLLAKRCALIDDRIPVNGAEREDGNADDPLDLSQKRNELEDQVCQVVDTKKNLPLDLSVK